MLPTLEVLTIGRVSVDLYSDRPGASFQDDQRFVKSVGGSPTNVAVAAARLGRRAAVITKVGDDPFGAYVRHKLQAFGVDTRFVGVHPTLPTPLAFAAMDRADDPTLVFYRYPQAPDTTIEPESIDMAVAVAVPILWVSASTLSTGTSAAAGDALLRARSGVRHTILDLDHRPQFWSSRAEATARVGAALEHCTVAVGNTVECEVAVGSGEPAEAARRLLDRGVEVAIVKRGDEGVLVATAGGSWLVPAHPVDVVCGLGAGDAFGGALCHGLLAGWDPRRSVEFANVAGAIVASRLLCSDAMPDEAEIHRAEGTVRATG
ncbi:MAG: 5-dehydro-2-deoxygluconokinase [Iamia sp.]